MTLESNPFLKIAIGGLFILPIHFSAYAGDCGTVVVDCKAQKISFQGMPKSSSCGAVDHITCGNQTTHNSPDGEPGKIGGLHHGVRVTYGVEILGIPGMGDDGGGKVFHMTSTNQRRTCPLKNNYGLGCITTTPEVLDTLLHKCTGSSLVITGAAHALSNGHQIAKKAPSRTTKQASLSDDSSRYGQYQSLSQSDSGLVSH